MGKRWRIRILLFLAVLGPGFVTANVDNDSGGILTYSQAGAQYGYSLLWTMIPITISLIVVQEMCARLRVGEDAAGIVVNVGGNKSGAENGQEQKYPDSPALSHGRGFLRWVHFVSSLTITGQTKKRRTHELYDRES